MIRFIAITAIALTATPAIAAPIHPELIEWGLRRAIATNQINPKGKLPSAIQDFLKLLQDGVTPEEASEQTGVKLETIKKLQGISGRASDKSLALANALIRGLTVANRTGEVGRTSLVSFQVQDLARSLRSGVELEKAIARVQLKRSIVDRLLKLGGGSW